MIRQRRPRARAAEGRPDGADLPRPPRAAGARRVEWMVVALAPRRAIRDFALAVAARHSRLDVLVNNAGVWLRRRRTSPEGIERTWATNVLAYFLVTALLLPLLRGAGGGRGG